jgi:hypothetical protein
MNWQPVSSMPVELRDGRQVLFMAEYGYVVVLQFERDISLPHRSRWSFPWDGVEKFTESELTHYCEITPPRGSGQ